MSRSLILAEVVGRDLIIATSHFESLDNPDDRNFQMNYAFKLVRDAGVKSAIVVGDYNFDAQKSPNEEAVLTENNMVDIVESFLGKEAYSRRKTTNHAEKRYDKIVTFND